MWKRGRGWGWLGGGLTVRLCLFVWVGKAPGKSVGPCAILFISEYICILIFLFFFALSTYTQKERGGLRGFSISFSYLSYQQKSRTRLATPLAPFFRPLRRLAEN